MRTSGWVCAVFLAAAVSLLAAPAGAQAPSPAPPLQAFLLASAPDSFADLQAHPGAIGVVYPTYFECAVPTGLVVGAPNAQIDAYAAAHDLIEMPRYTCQQGAVVHSLLTSPALRARTLAQLAALAVTSPYAGLDLDLENDGSADRGALSLFVQALARRLHAERRRLAVDVVGVTHEPVPRPAAGFYNYRALSANADTVFVMAWGHHWEGSAPGPLAPLTYVGGVAHFVASLPYARRFVVGVPMYGLDWAVEDPASPAARRVRPAHAVALQHAGAVAPGVVRRVSPPRAVALQYAGTVALAQAVGASPVRDAAADELTFAYTRAGVPHRVWYMDARAILDRVAIARRYGLAAGVWRLGEEDQALWPTGVPAVDTRSIIASRRNGRRAPVE